MRKVTAHIVVLPNPSSLITHDFSTLIFNLTMSNIQRFEPFRELERISNEISQQANSFFNRDSLTTFFNTDFLGGTALSDVAKRFTMGNVFENPLQNAFVPRVDVAEDENNIYFHVELPGMEKQDVSVVVNNDNVLVIKGERKNEFKEEGKHFVRMERGYSTFERSFTLPANVQTEAINAQFDNGVLNITLPKAESSKVKHIAIDVK